MIEFEKLKKIVEKTRCYRRFKKANIELTTLGDYDNLIEQALDTNYVSDKEFETLIEWRVAPSEWNK